MVMADSFRDMNSVKNYTLTPKAISEELAQKVNSFAPMAENHDGLIVEWDGDSTVSSEWSFNMTTKEDVTDPFDKFSNDDHPAISRDALEKFDRTMGATDTMALPSIQWSSSATSPSCAAAQSSPLTPSLSSQEDDSDLDDDDDDIMPDLVDIEECQLKRYFASIISRVASSPKDNSKPAYTNFNDDFFMTSIRKSLPTTHSPTLPSSPAVSASPNSPNTLFTLSDLKHRDPGYIQADSIIYANDSTWRW